MTARSRRKWASSRIPTTSSTRGAWGVAEPNNEPARTRIAVWRTRELLVARRPVSVGDLQSSLRDHDNFPDSVCRHEHPDDPRETCTTVISAIMDLEDRARWLTDGPPCERQYATYHPRVIMTTRSALRMQLGFVGLGRMRGNMVHRLVRGGHEVVAFNRSPGELEVEGHQSAGRAAQSQRLEFWIAAPVVASGPAGRLLDHSRCATRGVPACLARDQDPRSRGRLWRGGPNGAGHFVKMVHNGIEYGMMQAYAEGFQVLEKSEYAFDLTQCGKIWRRGSVVRSWPLDLALAALEKNPSSKSWRAGSTTRAKAAGRSRRPSMKTLTPGHHAGPFSRFYSRWLAALRNEFGGHVVRVDGQESGVRSTPV
jgi:6-phosphogluconate dehydrogenase, C-terminal domain/NAD binding domain of 6-phosphogluconate dehydrogenase